MVVHHDGGAEVDVPSLILVDATRVGSMENHEHDNGALHFYLVGASRVGLVGMMNLKMFLLKRGK